LGQLRIGDVKNTTGATVNHPEGAKRKQPLAQTCAREWEVASKHKARIITGNEK
jgi:hypothetical protein